ncbi:MAG: hypothetical protein QW816_06905 [Desulfurococcaceae archaeon]
MRAIYTICSWIASRFLRVIDFPEIRVEDGQVVFDEIPTMVIVRPEQGCALVLHIPKRGGLRIPKRLLRRED